MTYLLKTMTIRGDIDVVPYSSLYKLIEMYNSERRFKSVQMFYLDKQAGMVPIVP